MLDWVELTNMYKTFLPKQRDYTFSSAHGTFSRIDHMVGHKTSPNKFKKTEISSIFSDHTQWYEISNQLHGENQKIHTYIEIKQHDDEQQMEQRKKSKGKSKNTFRHMKADRKPVLIGKFTAIKAYIKK